MKKILYILVAFAFSLVSCSEDLYQEQDTYADSIVIRVFNSPMTKVSDHGLAIERKLNSLDCFFYKEGKTDEPCVYYIHEDVDATGQSEIIRNVDESVIKTIFGDKSTCEVFVIANLPSDITLPTNGIGTEVPTLSKIALELEKGYDDYDGPFVMAGLDIAEKGDNNNASGEIPLVRAASKITLTVTVPEEITAADGKIMVPIFEALNKEDQIEGTLKTAFHYGVKKSYLYDAYTGENEFFNSPEKVELHADGEPTGGKYIYKCEVPFYTYARAWEKGAVDAAYLTIDLMWVEKDKTNDATSYNTYYYQVLVNSSGRCFEPNHWYDLTVNLGVLGSVVELDPKEIKDITYYVLDWTTEPESDTGDRYEDVEITDYAYLVVPERNIVLNNTSIGTIKYSASHPIGIMMNTNSKPTEILNSPATTTKSSYYIKCNTNPATIQDLNPNITRSNFTVEVDEKGNEIGEITFRHTIPSSVYSPVFIYFTIWLDFDGDEAIDEDEEDFVEHITITQYPAIYILPDPSTLRSIYVNGTQSHNSSMDNVKLDDYTLGASTGVKNFESTANSTTNNSMYVINISALSSNNFFYAPPLDDNGYLIFNSGLTNPTEKCYYIIGDPRQRKSDIALDGSEKARSWAQGRDYISSTSRTLQYYYPTEKIGDAFKVIAPKYRIVSFNNASGKNCTPESAAMRCASVQEDGFPAGRWRLPTVAEVQFIINLQKEKVIEDIFLSSGSYYATAAYASKTQLVTLRQNGNNIEWNKRDGTESTKISVRCVYDEWYWGSERDAIINPSPSWVNRDINGNEHVGDQYLFTWGDKQIWDANGNLIY